MVLPVSMMSSTMRTFLPARLSKLSRPATGHLKFDTNCFQFFTNDVYFPSGLIILVGLDPDEVHADLHRPLGVVRVETVDLVQHVREELVAALTVCTVNENISPWNFQIYLEDTEGM